MPQKLIKLPKKQLKAGKNGPFWLSSRSVKRKWAMAILKWKIIGSSIGPKYAITYSFI